MKELLEQYIVEKIGHKPEKLDWVLEFFEEIEAPKNHVLLEVNEVCRKCFFVVEGCLKVVTYNYNGDESTINIVFEQEWRTSMHSFINQSPSNERMICVEKSRLLAINFEDFMRLSKEVPTFGKMYKSLLEESYTQSLERVQSLMALDALARVKWLLAQHPHIFTRLSNRLIASYLNLSEATLSRLKAKL